MRNRAAGKYSFAVGLASAVLLLLVACGKMAQLAPYTKYTSDAEVPRISIEDARKEFDDGTAVIIDARGDAAWNQEHIAGSISSGKIGPIEDNYLAIPKDKKIIVYCS